MTAKIPVDIRRALRIAGALAGLAVVLVGDDPASAVYVRNKDRAAQGAGLSVQTVRLPAATPEADLLAVIARLLEAGNVR